MARITKRQTLAQRSKFEELFELFPELFPGNRLFLMEGRFVGTDWEYNHQFTENYWLVWQVSKIEAIQEIKSKKV